MPPLPGDGVVGPFEQEDQKQTEDSASSGNFAGAVPRSRSRLLCDGEDQSFATRFF